tara:strand:- start:4517 stop:4714 length:198 start_codon:yes stop_codon:yes gene_type:complete
MVVGVYDLTVKVLRFFHSLITIVLFIFVISTLQKLINPSIFMLIIAIYISPVEVRDPQGFFFVKR